MSGASAKSTAGSNASEARNRAGILCLYPSSLDFFNTMTSSYLSPIKNILFYMHLLLQNTGFNSVVSEHVETGSKCPLWYISEVYTPWVKYHVLHILVVKVLHWLTFCNAQHAASGSESTFSSCLCLAAALYRVRGSVLRGGIVKRGHY